MNLTELTKLLPTIIPSGFAHPWYLLGLVVPIALMVWVWWPKPARLVLPYDHGPIGRGLAWRILLDMAASLPPLLLAITIVLLAEPQQFGDPKEKRALTNIEICLDVSYSMVESFGDGSRYDTAMKCGASPLPPPRLIARIRSRESTV